MSLSFEIQRLVNEGAISYERACGMSIDNDVAKQLHVLSMFQLISDENIEVIINHANLSEFCQAVQSSLGRLIAELRTLHKNNICDLIAHPNPSGICQALGELGRYMDPLQQTAVSCLLKLANPSKKVAYALFGQPLVRQSDDGQPEFISGDLTLDQVAQAVSVVPQSAEFISKLEALSLIGLLNTANFDTFFNFVNAESSPDLDQLPPLCTFFYERDDVLNQAIFELLFGDVSGNFMNKLETVMYLKFKGLLSFMSLDYIKGYVGPWGQETYKTIYNKVTGVKSTFDASFKEAVV